jgi:hypothetical protein
MVPPPKYSLSLVLVVIANWLDDCASIGLGVLPQAFQDADLASSRTISDARRLLGSMPARSKSLSLSAITSIQQRLVA